MLPLVQLRTGVSLLDLEKKPTHAFIEVRDFGIGMDEETRSFYNLEGLWSEGRELELPPEVLPSTHANVTEHHEG